MTDNTYQDKEVVCRDCKQLFPLTAGEQQFFAEKGLFTPTRCKPCRQANKARREAETVATGGPSPQQGTGGDPRPRVVEMNGGGGQGPRKGGGGGKRAGSRRGEDDWDSRGGGWR